MSTKPQAERSSPDVIVVALPDDFCVDAVRRDADGVIVRAVNLLTGFPDVESAEEWGRKYARDHGLTFEGEQS